MAYACRVLADSVSPLGIRLTTLEATFPRIVLAEFNTHRVFSRNSASSRAIPVIKQLRRVMEDPFVPERFGKNERGMQSYSFHEGASHEEAVRIWLRGRDRAFLTAVELLLGEGLRSKVFGANPTYEELVAGLPRIDDEIEAALDTTLAPALNVHKQIANRVLEPYMWHTVIVSATEWSNFFALRVDQNAQGEIFKIADLMERTRSAWTPQELDFGMWHLPLIQWQESEEAVLAHDPGGLQRLMAISAGRCARVSYLTHYGFRNIERDEMLCRSLVSNGHMSPLEHIGTPMPEEDFRRIPWSGNFRGWRQYRKGIPDEDDFGKIKERIAAETAAM